MGGGSPHPPECGTCDAGERVLNVCLTIDVETYSGDYDCDVYGHGLGLPFILDMCRHYGATATFFVETLGATRWGPTGIQRICADLNAAGQDIQLHIHPVVAQVDWVRDRCDVLWMHDRPLQERLIELGHRILSDCAGRPAEAFRAGDFAANADTLTAMDNLGILIGSNRDLDTKCSTRSRLNEVFPIRNDVSRLGRIIDVPTSALRSPLKFLDGPYRHMQVSALGAAETIDALLRMERAGYACATILTHPGEYFRALGGRLVPVGKNRRRLKRILSFLAGHPAMRVLTVGDCARVGPVRVESPPELRLNLPLALQRVCEQSLDRMRRKMA